MMIGVAFCATGVMAQDDALSAELAPATVVDVPTTDAAADKVEMSLGGGMKKIMQIGRASCRERV